MWVSSFEKFISFLILVSSLYIAIIPTFHDFVAFQTEISSCNGQKDTSYIIVSYVGFRLKAKTAAANKRLLYRAGPPREIVLREGRDPENEPLFRISPKMKNFLEQYFKRMTKKE